LRKLGRSQLHYAHSRATPFQAPQRRFFDSSIVFQMHATCSVRVFQKHPTRTGSLQNRTLAEGKLIACLYDNYRDRHLLARYNGRIGQPPSEIHADVYPAPYFLMTMFDLRHTARIACEFIVVCCCCSAIDSARISHLSADRRKQLVGCDIPLLLFYLRMLVDETMCDPCGQDLFICSLKQTTDMSVFI
jgi:hypothetical protein